MCPLAEKFGFQKENVLDFKMYLSTVLGAEHFPDIFEHWSLLTQGFIAARNNMFDAVETFKRLANMKRDNEFIIDSYHRSKDEIDKVFTNYLSRAKEHQVKYSH